MTEQALPPLEPRPPCEKRRYSSKRQARLEHLRAPFRIRVYWCARDCNAYHVTNDDKNVVKGDAASVRRRRRIADLRNAEAGETYSD